jgi:RNA polymerase sigma-70 factor (ECF subfamily)
VGHRADAEDVAQEALLRAWRHRARCNDPECPLPWVLRICRNEALRRLSQRSPELAPLEQAAAAGVDELEPVAARVDLRAALACVREDDRLLLWLRYGMDLTQEAVAERLGIAEGTAKVRLHRLREALRKDPRVNG